MIQQYVDFVYLSYIQTAEFDEEAGKNWIDSSSMRTLFVDAMRKSLMEYGYDVGDRYDQIAETYFEEMLAGGVIRQEGDNYTGVFCRFEVRPKDVFVINHLKDNPVRQRIEVLGTLALSTALSNISNSEGWIKLGEAAGEQINRDAVDRIIKDDIPAADRYVGLDDNSAARDEIIGRIDQIADAVRGHNDQDGKLDQDRERIGSELAAAKELLKAPRARVRAIWVVLVGALGFIAKEFAGAAIGQMALDLLEALKPFLGS